MGFVDNDPALSLVLRNVREPSCSCSVPRLASILSIAFHFIYCIFLWPNMCPGALATTVLRIPQPTLRLGFAARSPVLPQRGPLLAMSPGPCPRCAALACVSGLGAIAAQAQYRLLRFFGKGYARDAWFGDRRPAPLRVGALVGVS
jgi:hypothetical protein